MQRVSSMLVAAALLVVAGWVCGALVFALVCLSACISSVQTTH